MKKKLSVWKNLSLSLIPALFLLLNLQGCKEGPTEVEEEKTALKVEKIIFNPKSAEPGETVKVTAVVTSSSQNVGDYPTFSWSSDGGRFIDNNKISVKWLSPDSSSIYTLRVQAKNSVSTSSLSAKIFVGGLLPVVYSSAGGMIISQGGDSLFYLYSPYDPESDYFQGFTVSIYEQGSSRRVTTQLPGFEYSFSKNSMWAAHTYETLMEDNITVNPKDIILDNLSDRSQAQITQDHAHYLNLRKQQHTEPHFSPDGELIAFQSFHPDIDPPSRGGIDTFDVYVHSLTTSETHRITSGFKNFHPSFSSDGQFLTFVSDRSGEGGWELFAMPVAGGLVDTSTVIRLTYSGGAVSSPDVFPPADPLKEWNPDPSTPVLALKDSYGKLRLIRADGSGEIAVDLGGIIRYLAWSRSGEKLAVSTGSAIYLVNPSGDFTLVYRSPTRDMLIDLSWSRDGSLLVYSATRVASTWYELIDIGGVAGLSSPVMITPSLSTGAMSTYRGYFSIAPVWGRSSRAYILVFDGSTPRVEMLDLSGVYQ